MPIAEIIAIGSELLLGETQDTNTRYLGRTLRDHGIPVLRSTIIGDDIVEVAAAICESAARADIIITTGGLGPTVDDPTREAVAHALGVETVYMEQLWEQVRARFMRYGGRQPTENNRRQAYIPAGATPITNPVGTAPAFMVAKPDWLLYCLPGVPLEMKNILHNQILPDITKRFELNHTILVRVLHTISAGESTIDAQIGDLEKSINPSVGLLAHPGSVDIRITSGADSLEEARASIQQVENIIRDRLGSLIYGSDGQTLEGVVLQLLEEQNLRLAVVECGLGGGLLSRLVQERFPPENIKIYLDFPGGEALSAALEHFKAEVNADLGLGVCLHHNSGKQAVDIVILPMGAPQHTQLHFGGSHEMAKTWTGNRAMDALRTFLTESQSHQKKQ
jgi:nicotinamide-nucleotide amidase